LLCMLEVLMRIKGLLRTKVKGEKRKVKSEAGTLKYLIFKQNEPFHQYKRYAIQGVCVDIKCRAGGAWAHCLHHHPDRRADSAPSLPVRAFCGGRVQQQRVSL